MFRLGLAEWRKIDERFDLGPFELLKRVAAGRWKVDHLRETIRLALVAGKSVVNAAGAVDDQRIGALVREFVDERPLLLTAMFVAALLTSILDEPAGDSIPKSVAATATDELSQMGNLPSPPSTDGALSSATRRPKSTHSRSGSSAPALPATKPRTVRNRRQPPQAPPSLTT